uniref:Uncharacterized protein n=1 Tax=Peronospora matthiolae TaxID=2874970 RepID=A0AAV1V5S6_9STRA
MRIAFSVFLLLGTISMCRVDLVSGLKVSADGQPPREKNLAIRGLEIATGDDGRSVLRNDKEMHREPRGVFDRLAAFLRRAPKTSKMDPRGAEDALTHVRAVVDRGGMSSTKFTPGQVKALKRYRAEKPVNWFELAYYLHFTLGLSMAAFIMWGAYYHGWRPYMISGPHRNP